MDPAPLNGLAIWRCTRFVALGDPTDLNEAIGLWHQAIPLTSLRSRRWERYSGNLAIALKERFRRTRDVADIDHAIALVEAAVGRDTASSSQHLDLLGILLQERFRALHDTADIEKAIQAHRNACALAQSTPMAAKYEANLANALRLTLNLGSLNEAIEIQNRLIADKSRDDLDFRTRINLGSCLRARYNLTRDKRDYDAVLATLEHSFEPAMDAHVEAALIGARDWGDWEFRNESWARALQAYGHVRDALHRIMQTQTLRRGSELWLRETQGVFARAAYAASKLGDFASALTFLEFGSARLLTMQLQLSRVAAETLKEEGHADLGDALLECMEEIAFCRRLAAESSWLETIAGAPHANYPIEQLRKAQQTLSEVREKIQQIEGFSDILEPPALDEIRAGLGDAAVVYVTATDAGGQALLIRSSGAPPEVLWLPDLTGRALEEMTTKYWEAYESWLNGVDGGLEQWKTELDRATQLLWRWIMGHMVEAFEPGSTVYIVPIGGLALLPLHAAWTPDPETPTARLYAMDKICITYLPNASALVGARSREDGPPRNILVVEDPQPVEAKSLVYSAIEVETALSGFAAHHVLRHGTATRNAILNSLPSFAVVHFACHANANIIQPLKSGLLVAFSEEITVQNLLEIRLENVRLAVLSACETAIPGRELPDEMIGLPTALLYAGASNIIASLWAVADLSTAILMARFYWVWRHNGAEPKIAMRAAQRWLRDATASEISQFVGESFSVLQARNDNSAESMRTVLASFPEKQPFAHPHFWAAFTYVGA
ncbi:CHAT domain-containing protein [Bradyrhizobium sp. CW1]|nr:CHAT domain-containing protein [Bradyrhizobium sp. CW1]UPJ26548.1 CHAT domain-containing protein [Bradyrhizobium sp. CW1]